VDFLKWIVHFEINFNIQDVVVFGSAAVSILIFSG